VKRNRYPLEVVRRQRERTKETALASYSERLEAVTRAGAELAALQRSLERDLVELDSAQTSLVSDAAPREVGLLRTLSDGVIAIHERVQRDHDSIATKREELAGAKEDCSEARQKLAHAMRHVKALERHFERWQTRRKEERDRREEKVLDDVASIAWVTAKRGKTR